MEAISIRKKLHQYVDEGDEKLLKLMYALAKQYNEDEEGTERKDWDLLNKKNLDRFYSEEEPEYNLSMVKEPNPDYKK